MLVTKMAAPFQVPFTPPPRGRLLLTWQGTSFPRRILFFQHRKNPSCYVESTPFHTGQAWKHHIGCFCARHPFSSTKASNVGVLCSATFRARKHPRWVTRITFLQTFRIFLP